MKARFFSVLAAIAVIAGCAKEVSFEEAKPVTPGKRQVTITANIAQTKTTVSDEGMYSWENTEQIGVVETNSEGDVIPFTVKDAANGTFSGTLTGKEEPVIAVTPISAVSDVIEMNGDFRYTIKFGDIADYVPGTTNALMIGTKPTAGSENSYSFEFRHAAALIKVPVVNVPVGTAKVKLTMDEPITGTWANLNSANPVLTPSESGVNNVTLTLKDAISEPNTSANFYFPVPVNTYTSFQFELLDANGDRLKGVKKTGLKITLAVADLFITPTITLPATPFYRKVTSTSDLKEGGSYLIVYEGDDNHSSVAFDGSLETIDANENGIAVTINDNTIASTTALDAAAFIISIENGTVCTTEGKYIGVSSYANGLSVSTDANNYVHSEISIKETTGAFLAFAFSSGDMTLRYNYASNTLRFRYYKDNGQQPIALYLLDGTGTVAKQDPNISYTETNFSITEGEEFTAPEIVNPYSLAGITYDSSNTDVATVNASTGAVTIEGTGSTTITASFAGNDTYKAGSASYLLNVNPGLQVVTVAQFLAKEVSTNAWYQLNGKLTNIDGTNGAKYGNFTLVDATGSVYVYGLTKTQQISNDQSFASIGLVEGDIVTINTLRSEHSGTAQAGGTIPAYYVSHLPARTISVNPDSKTVAATDTKIDVTITSNCAWTITGEGFTANPSTGTSGETAVVISFDKRTVAGDGTITATITADDDAEVYKTVTITQHGTDYVQPTGWIATALSDIAAGDVFVIVGNNGSNYAMTNDNGTSSAPAAFAVTVADGKITSPVTDKIKWNISGDATNGYTFYPNGSTTTWLYCTNTNNGVRVGTGDAKHFTHESNGYLKTSETTDARYIGVYSSQDWRCYTSASGNIGNQTFTFYKLFGEEVPALQMGDISCTDNEENENSLTFSWKAVTGATGYQVSTDGSTFGSTQSGLTYTLSGLKPGTSHTIWVKAIGDGTNYTDSEAKQSAPGTTKSNGSGGNDPVEVTFTAGTDKGDTSVTKDGITVEMSTMSRDDNYRTYANSNMTVTASSGKTIIKVVVTCTASGTSNNGPGKFSGDGYSYSGTEGTWSGSSNSVSLSASAQVRMTKIVVTYTE